MVGKVVIHVSMLQFVDDTLLFCHYDSLKLNVLKHTMELFEWISGLTIKQIEQDFGGKHVHNSQHLTIIFMRIML